MENSKSKSNKKYKSNSNKPGSDRKYSKDKKYRSNSKSSSDRKYGKDKRDANNKTSEFANTRKTILNNLNTQPDWVDTLGVNPIPFIIKTGSPAEVFLLLKNVYELTHTHALYRLVESGVFKQKGIHKISGRINNHKNVDPELSFYFQLQKIHQLVNLGATDYLNVIKGEIVKLMNFQDKNGRFPMNYHHHAHACNLLIDLGLEGNKLIDKAINWVLSRQRDDGGWIHINNMPKGANQKDAPSCIWTTAEIAKLLTKRKIFKNSDNLSKAKNFLTDNYLNKNKSTLLPKSDAWECLTVNHTSEHMFAGGTLKILEIFLNSKVENIKHIKKMIDWLKAQQMENSLYPKIANKHPVSDILVTNRVLFIFKKYSKFI